jgi:hypothetical protein
MTGVTQAFALVGAATLTIAVAGCQKYSSGGDASPDSIKETIKADQKKRNGQFKSQDLEGLLGHYADDAYSFRRA